MSIKTPQAKAWGYTDKACPELRRRARLRGLKSKTTFDTWIWSNLAGMGEDKHPRNDYSRY